MIVRRMSLPFIGTTLTLPNFGRRVRLCAVAVANPANNVVRLGVLNGAGELAFESIAAGTATPTCWAPVSDIGGIISPIPGDLVIEETDSVRLVAAAAIATTAVISFTELEK